MKEVAILIHENFATELAEKLATPHRLRTIGNQSDDEITTMLAETDVLVSAKFKPEWRAAGSTSHLQLVHSVGAGVEGIDLKSLPRGCKVCNVYGHERGVAEHAVLLMLALQRNVFKMDAALRKGNWTPQHAYLSELRNRNLLIFGFGHIGKEVARWGCFLEMNVTALTRTPFKEGREKSVGCVVGSLKDLPKHLSTADFVVVAIPATSETINLIGEKELQAMKRSAFLINVGRARVVHEGALYHALRARRIAGAGLDVWYEYPASLDATQLPSRFPFQDLDNVIMTPHKPTVETMAYRWTKIAENIHRFNGGEPLQNVVCTA